MRTYDISPLWRSTIRQVDAAQHAAGEDDYPPCNVEHLSDDRWPASLLMISSIGASHRSPSSGSSTWPIPSGWKGAPFDNGLL
jgi:hypothetical protein